MPLGRVRLSVPLWPPFICFFLLFKNKYAHEREGTTKNDQRQSGTHTVSSPKIWDRSYRSTGESNTKNKVIENTIDHLTFGCVVIHDFVGFSFADRNVQLRHRPHQILPTERAADLFPGGGGSADNVRKAGDGRRRGGGEVLPHHRSDQSHLIFCGLLSGLAFS